VAALTGASPTAGLVFYDLKTTVRLAADEPAAAAVKPPARRRKKETEEGVGEGP
jgi:hypothetical protein